jgi:hypothetical protein
MIVSADKQNIVAKEEENKITPTVATIIQQVLSQ